MTYKNKILVLILSILCALSVMLGVSACKDETGGGEAQYSGTVVTNVYVNASGYLVMRDQNNVEYQIGKMYMPSMSVSSGGYWVIDGRLTEFRAVGEDGKTTTVGISSGYWVLDGRLTEFKAIGEDGLTPTITVSDDGYWVINNQKTAYSARGEKGETGNSGTQGSNGKSAYELYCEQYGYSGTLAEWLDDLANGELYTKQITVTFDYNGLSNSVLDEYSLVNAKTVTKGNCVSLPAIPVESAYGEAFEGWYYGEGVNEVRVSELTPLYRDVTLRAKWNTDAPVGLSFTYNDESDSYYLSSYVGGESSLTVPALYFTAENGLKAVTGIYSNAFEDASCAALAQISLPASLDDIHADTFKNTALYSDASKWDEFGLLIIDDYVFGYDSTKNEQIAAGGEIVEIPQSCKVIAGYTFSGSSIEDVTLPDSLVIICDGAFNEAEQLNKVRLNQGSSTLAHVGNYAFNGCSALTAIQLPSNLKTLGDGAFSFCTQLSEVDVLNGCALYSIGKSAFESTAITSFNFTAKLTHIGASAFYATDLTSVNLPLGIVSVGRFAFYNCNELLTVNLSCNATLGIGVFENCSSLNTVTFSGDARDVGERMFKSCALLSTVNLSGKIAAIGDSAFENCTSLASISGNALRQIGQKAFAGCSSLAAITVNGGEVRFDKDALINTAFYSSSANWTNGGLYLTDYTGNFKYLLRVNASAATIFNVADATTAVCPYAFDGSTIEKVALPQSVAIIFSYAFANAASLGEVTMSATQTQVGEFVFAGCGTVTVNVPAVCSFDYWSVDWNKLANSVILNQE